MLGKSRVGQPFISTLIFQKDVVNWPLKEFVEPNTKQCLLIATIHLPHSIEPQLIQMSD